MIIIQLSMETVCWRLKKRVIWVAQLVRGLSVESVCSYDMMIICVCVCVLSLDRAQQCVCYVCVVSSSNV